MSFIGQRVKLRTTRVPSKPRSSTATLNQPSQSVPHHIYHTPSRNFNLCDYISRLHLISLRKVRVLLSRMGMLEMDRESCGSPAAAKVVVAADKWKGMRAHSQILRIRAEDSHLGEDIGEGSLSLKDKLGVTHFVLFSRHILPASPLGGKTAH